MKKLFKPCCDLCSYLLTILSIVLLSSSVILLTYTIAKDFSNNNSIQKSVGSYDITENKIYNSEIYSALISSNDPQKTDTCKEMYTSKNKAVNILKEK